MQFTAVIITFYRFYPDHKRFENIDLLVFCKKLFIDELLKRFVMIAIQRL